MTERMIKKRKKDEKNQKEEKERVITTRKKRQSKWYSRRQAYIKKQMKVLFNQDLKRKRNFARMKY